MRFAALLPPSCACVACAAQAQRRITAFVLIAAASVAGCGPSPDRQTLVGRYTMHITARDSPPWRGMVGDWQFEFRGDGRLYAHQAGGKQMAITNVYRFDGELLTINDLEGNGSCRHFGVDAASATYRVRFTEAGFEASPLRDECGPRVYGMTVHSFRRTR